VAALHELRLVERHVVAQVVETEFIVGAVRDVAQVLLATLGWSLAREDHTGGHAKRAINAPHELTLVFGQEVVGGDHVNAATRDCVQVCGRGCHKGFSFTGAHFGDVAEVQSGTTHELHVEVTHT
jgi:hypothetical protein